MVCKSNNGNDWLSLRVNMDDYAWTWLRVNVGDYTQTLTITPNILRLHVNKTCAMIVQSAYT